MPPVVPPVDHWYALADEQVSNAESPLQIVVCSAVIVGVTGVFLVMVTGLENAEQPKLSVIVTV